MRMNNRIKYLEALCRTQENELDNLESKIRKIQANMLTIDDAKHRDYIVRTKYIGKLKDDILIKDFKAEISDTIGDKFDSICSKILNYQLIDLQRYKDILRIYEMKQIVLDVYGTNAKSLKTKN